MEEENPAVCFGLPYDLRQCWGPVQTTVQPCPCFLISIVTLSWYAHRSISMLNSARRHITHSAVMVALGPAPNYATKHLRAPLHPKHSWRHGGQLEHVLSVTGAHGSAEHFMHTIMDKSEAMQHEACIPDSWWEFTITHAMHVYNRAPLQCHNWCTPYEMLHKQQPDIVHLQVFRYIVYVHISEDIRTNKMAPKSELMVYLGVAPGNTTNFLFMQSPNNILSLLYMHFSMSCIIHAVYLPACILLHNLCHLMPVSMCL